MLSIGPTDIFFQVRVEHLGGALRTKRRGAAGALGLCSLLDVCGADLEFVRSMLVNLHFQCFQMAQIESPARIVLTSGGSTLEVSKGLVGWV